MRFHRIIERRWNEGQLQLVNRWIAPIGRFGLPAVALGLLIVFEPVFAIALIGLVVFVAWALWRLQTFLFTVLLAKPLVDLSWNLPILNYNGAPVNVQGAYAIAVMIALTFFVLIKERMRLSVPIALLLFFWFSATLSLLIGGADSDSIANYVRFTSGVPFLILGHHLFSSYELAKKLAFALALVLLVPFSIAVLQHAGLVSWGYQNIIEGELGVRATGGYKHPLDIYRYLLTVLPLLYFVYLQERSLRIRVALATFFLAAMFVTYTSMLRMAIISLCCQGFVVSWASKHRALAVIMAIIVPIGIALTIPELFREHLQNLGDPSQFAEFFNMRGAIWLGFLQMYDDGPLHSQLFGFGLSADAVVYADQYYYAPDELTDPHSDFIRILVAQGLVGLLLYFGFIVSIAIALRRQTRFALTRAEKDFNIVCSAILVGFLVMGISTTPSVNPSALWYVFAALSTVAGRGRPASRRPTEIQIRGLAR